MHRDSNAGDGDSGWSEIVLDPARKVDLLELTNGLLDELGEMPLPAGKYTQLRLVLADVGPLKDALQANEQIIERLEAELYAARASFGIGVNGIGIGVAYLLWQVGFQSRTLGQDVFVETLGVAAISAIALELVNWLFLAKRKKMRQLANEINGARQDGRTLEQKIREASRV